MPLPVLRSYVTMLPRLEAEESIAAASRIGVGTGSLPVAERMRLIRAWQDAEAGGHAPVVRTTDPTTRAALAAGAGIGVEYVGRA